MTLQQLVRPNIWNLSPYVCARNEYTGEARAWLDANENSIIEGLNRYPDPLQLEVKEAIGKLRGVSPNRIFLGVGSDECIDMCYRVFCVPGVDNVVAIDPTYGMYKVCADINDIAYRPVPLNDDFSLDLFRLLNAVDEHTKILWICSPNNPTGNAFDPEELAALARRFEGITVVDEAYVDFSAKGSILPVLDECPRLVVMQTFSKAWASAAMRLGIAYASREIIDIFNKVKYPYNINILTQREALAVLAGKEHVMTVAKELVEARDSLADALADLPAVKKVYPSDANFLLVEVTDADGLYAFLKTRGVIVRNRTRVTLCGNCLRITVGNAAENRLLLQEISDYAGDI